MKKMGIWRKKIAVLASTIMFICTLPSQVYANNIQLNTKNNDLNIDELASMSGADCIDELEKYGLVLSEVYVNNPSLAEKSVEVILDDIIDGRIQNGVVPYNYTELVELASQVENIVETYAASYTLKNSTVIGSWDNAYEKYNCYGFAIDKTMLVNPGYYCNKNFDMTMSISSMADLVIKDLDKLGYYASKSTTKPTSLANYERLICIRKGSVDYHFMKGNTINYWTHKPGKTNPLKWSSTNPASSIWTNESSYKNICYAGTTTYNSSIIYIKYFAKNSSGGPAISSLKDYNVLENTLVAK